MRPKTQASEPLTASVHYNGNSSILIKLWFHGQIGLSMADSFAEQTGFADASVTSIWLFIRISVLALHCLTERCKVLGRVFVVQWLVSMEEP